MNEKEIKNVDVVEEVTVDMTIEETEPKETKKEKAIRFTKAVGAGLWEGVKVTCAGVGAIVLGALAVGVALRNKKEDESSEYSGGELDTDGTSTTNETSDETSDEEFNL